VATIGTASPIDLRQYLDVLQRRRWTIILTTMSVIGLAIVGSWLQEPQYAATAEVLLRPGPDEARSSGTERPVAQNIPTEIQLIKSSPIQNRVRAAIGLAEAPEVTVRQLPGTEFLTIRAEHSDPDRAAAIANAYANEYIDYRRDQIVDALTSVTGRIQNQIIKDEERIAEIDRGLPPDGSPLSAAQQQAASEREGLLRRVATSRDNVTNAQADAAAASGAAQVVTPATAATSPFEPRLVRSGVLAGVLGLCFALGLAFLVDHLDDTVKSKDEIEQLLGGISVLGIIPFVGGWKQRERPLLVSIAQPQSPAAESYRTIRTAIQFFSLDKPVRTLQITSAGAQEGKTTTVSNLAVALASAGRRVVVVDCDLRRPRLHTFFGVPNNHGFTSVLLGELPLTKAVQPLPVANLNILTSGPLPPNPSELLSGARAVETLASLAAHFDVVMIDTPPLLPVTDAAAVAAQVDATLLVATAGVTTKRSLARAAELLGQVKAPLVGVIFNGASVDEAYAYGYGYGPRPSAPNPPSRKRRAAPPSEAAPPREPTPSPRPAPRR
jgi:polysaccharide biosynthesis transport protein